MEVVELSPLFDDLEKAITKSTEDLIALKAKQPTPEPLNPTLGSIPGGGEGDSFDIDCILGERTATKKSNRRQQGERS